MQNLRFYSLLFCSIITGLAAHAQLPERGLQDADDASFISLEVMAYFSLPPPKRGMYFAQYTAPGISGKGKHEVSTTYSADVMLLDMETLAEQSMGFDEDWNTMGELQILNPKRLPEALRDYQTAIRENKYLGASDLSTTSYALPNYILTEKSLYSFEAAIMIKYATLVPTGRVKFIHDNLASIPLELLRLMQLDLNQLYRVKAAQLIATRPDMLVTLANYHL